jgi:hypothetical protein
MSRCILGAAIVFACASGVSAAQERPSEIQKAVEEFKIQTRNLGLRPDSPRRKGRSAVRPEWHGRLYENFRNDLLDAVPHEVRQRGGAKSTLRRNQFGFNVGGPVLIPWIYDGGRSTHFSLSYEGVRESISRSYLQTLPTLPERVGDWSATVDQAGNSLPIYDMRSTRRNSAFDPSQPVSTGNLEYLRDPFPGNRIPADRLDPVAQKALAFYPAPNTNVGPFFRNNYFILAPETNVANGMILKVDHAIRERHRLTLDASFSNGLLGAARWFPNAANPGPSDRDFSSRYGSIEHIFTASARTVNAFSFSARTDGSETGRGDEAGFASQMGLRGVSDLAFPVFSMTYLNMGRTFPNSKNVRNSFSWSDAFSTRRGRHGLRVTGRYTRSQVNTYWPQYPAGLFRFSSGLTSLPGIVNTGHSFASFLLGLSDYAAISVVQSPSYFRNSSGQLAVRDSYEAGRGISFQFGVNVETSTPRTEKYDRQGTIDLDAVNPANGRKGAYVAAGTGGWGRSFQPVRTRVEPSAGLSWTPGGDTRTVLRLSYSRSYSAIPIYSGQWGTQGFNGTPNWISPNVQLEPAVTLSEGLPPMAQKLPDLRPEAVNDTIADLIDATDRQPMYQSANLSAERELPGSVVLTLGAGHSGGRDLLVGNWAANPNAIRLEALEYRDLLNDEEFNRSLRPYPQYKGFELNGLYPRGRYQRNAGYLRLEKRATRGLTISAYYELSKQMDDYSGPGTQDYINSRNEWSLTPGNNPHRLSLSYAYELPLGANKALFSYSDWRRYLVDGWSLSGASSLFSGEPLALRPEFNNTGGVVNTLRVNVVPGVDPHIPRPGPELWFNPSAFDQPPDFTLGNASRTHPTLRSARSQNHDVSLTKRFGLAADRTVEFSAVGLNFLNHANWTDPDVVIGPASAPNVNAGKIIGSRGGRVIQLGLRFSF